MLFHELTANLESSSLIAIPNFFSYVHESLCYNHTYLTNAIGLWENSCIRETAIGTNFSQVKLVEQRGTIVSMSTVPTVTQGHWTQITKAGQKGKWVSSEEQMMCVTVPINKGNTVILTPKIYTYRLPNLVP